MSKKRGLHLASLLGIWDFRLDWDLQILPPESLQRESIPFLWVELAVVVHEEVVVFDVA